RFQQRDAGPDVQLVAGHRPAGDLVSDIDRRGGVEHHIPAVRPDRLRDVERREMREHALWGGEVENPPHAVGGPESRYAADPLTRVPKQRYFPLPDERDGAQCLESAALPVVLATASVRLAASAENRRGKIAHPAGPLDHRG